MFTRQGIDWPSNTGKKSQPEVDGASLDRHECCLAVLFCALLGCEWADFHVLQV